MSWLRHLRRLVLGDPRQLARAAQVRRVTPEAALRARFLREYRVPRGSHSTFLILGHVEGPDGKPVAVGLPVWRVVGECGSTVLDIGPSRSGKTRLALSISRQALRIPGLRTWSIDPKGDLASGRARLFAAAAEQPGGEALIERLRLIRLFDRTDPPPLRLTAREEGVPVAVQAASVSTALAEASGAELGSRMGHILHYPSELAVQTDRPLTCILDWLARPAVFAAAAADSPNERLRHFASYELPRENKESVRALRARLERVLLLPAVKRAVEARTCFNFTEALERFDVDIDASNPPAGEEAAVRMLCGPLFGRMTRAVLNRRVTAGTTPVLCFIDELPEVLGRFEGSTSVARLTSLAGSRLVNYFLIAQDRVQLGADLFNLLRTNSLVEALFRPSHRDAELVAHALPVPDGAEHPSQAREELVRQITRMPRRHFLFWCKDGAVPSHVVRAPRVDLEKLPPPERLHELLRVRRADDALAPAERPSPLEAQHDESRSGPFEAGSTGIADEPDLHAEFPNLG